MNSVNNTWGLRGGKSSDYRRKGRITVLQTQPKRPRKARGKRYGDICICITDSLCYKAETNTPL